ncbi:hypothetical protein B0H19DRAFT_1071069 [Mycena capillaripes]|nr:hypothetical protein B0H19DRAFT_1071069 [Mycena capillaripes]
MGPISYRVVNAGSAAGAYSLHACTRMCDIRDLERVDGWLLNPMFVRTGPSISILELDRASSSSSFCLSYSSLTPSSTTTDKCARAAQYLCVQLVCRVALWRECLWSVALPDDLRARPSAESVGLTSSLRDRGARQSQRRRGDLDITSWEAELEQTKTPTSWHLVGTLTTGPGKLHQRVVRKIPGFRPQKPNFGGPKNPISDKARNASQISSCSRFLDSFGLHLIVGPDQRARLNCPNTDPQKWAGSGPDRPQKPKIWTREMAIFRAQKPNFSDNPLVELPGASDNPGQGVNASGSIGVIGKKLQPQNLSSFL